jgi:TetR/AcrR family transcriptional repressor of nem operon
MKVSREQAAHNRARVLQAAARLFRERGFDGVGVADLMASVGLTHGGFYAQFPSKEDLVAEACAAALDASVARWQKAAGAAPRDAAGAVVDSYLSCAHRDAPGSGCALAALGTEIARQGPLVREVVTEGVRDLVAVLADTMPGKTAEERRHAALGSFATMVGAMVLARAVADEKLSREVLAAAKERIPESRQRA